MKKLLFTLILLSSFNALHSMNADCADSSASAQSANQSMITIVTNDGKQYEIDKELAERSLAIKSCTELQNKLQTDPAAKTIVSLPNLTSTQWQIVYPLLQNSNNHKEINLILKYLTNELLIEAINALDFLDVPIIFTKAMAEMSKRIADNIAIADSNLIDNLAPHLQQAIALGILKHSAIWQYINITQLTEHQDFTHAVWSPDGKYLASYGDDNDILFIWNAHNWQEEPEQLLLDEDFVGCSISWSPDSKFLAAGHHDGTVHVFNMSSSHWQTAFKTLPNNSNTGISSLIWSPNGTFLAYGNYNEEITILKTEDWCELPAASNMQGYFVTWSPDECFIACGNNNGAIKIYALEIPETYKNLTIKQAVVLIKLFQKESLTDDETAVYVMLPAAIQAKFPLDQQTQQSIASKRSAHDSFEREYLDSD